MIRKNRLMSKAEHIKSITKKIQSLPTLPPVVKKLTKMVESPDVTARDLGKLISSDQVLSAKVLKLVNSPFYGFPGRISSISHAIILLGFNVIKGVVLSASVFDLMEQSMVGLWEHSLACAIVAGTISRVLDIPEPEEVSTAALLHDIGKVVVKVSMPIEYDKIIDRIEKFQCSFREAEREIIGTDHSEIGGWLCDEWNLPWRLSIPVMYHHKPNEAPKTKDRVAVVHLADALVRAFDIGSGGDPFVPVVMDEAWNTLGMWDRDVDDLIRRTYMDIQEVDNFKLV